MSEKPGKYTIEKAGLKPDTQNANQGTQRGRGLLEKSLRKLGAGRSILVDKDGNVIAGNKTLEGAAEIDLPVRIVETDGTELVVVKRTDLDLYSDKDKRARQLAYADNKVAELDLSWKPEQIAVDFTPLELGEWGFDNVFTESKDTEPQIDRAAELNEKWQVKPGDLWQIGEHRLLCGDSTKREDVEKVMGGEKADMVFTDPPYNYAENMDGGIFEGTNGTAMQGLVNSEWDKGFVISVFLDILKEIVEKNSSIYICTSHFLAGEIWNSFFDWCDRVGWCVWHKPNPMPSLQKRHWTWSAELIIYATNGKHVFNFPESGHAPNVWQFQKHKDTQHPTEKPVEVPTHAITHSSITGAIIFDGFSGSGTTLVACQNLSRKCRAIEISPNYCAVTLERMATAFPELEIKRVE